MPRRFLIALGATVHVAFCSSSVSAQGLIAQAYSQQKPGAYLSWWKLLIVIGLFLVWVKMTDWVNKDGMKIGEATRLKPEVWNPISIGCMLVGFWCAISVPIFWAGLSIYVIAVFTPFLIYFFQRRGKIKASPGIANKLKAGPNEPAFETLVQDEGAPVTFKAAGSGTESQANLIRARQNGEAFQRLKSTVMDGFKQRADVLMMDYTRDMVKSQLLIDGTWHALESVDRETGDAILVSLKCLAGANPVDRRSRQQGQFKAVIDDEKLGFDFLSQGVPTGERVQLKFLASKKAELTLPQLGMWPDMVRNLSNLLTQPGLVIVSGPPRQGLSTTWRGTLFACDRITRDWISILDENEEETVIENIKPYRFNAAAGESPATGLPKIMLSQPDALVVPNIVNSETLDMLTDQVVNHERTVVTQIPANNAAEALLRLYRTAGDKKRFAQAVTAITGQRLSRRLCDTCKVSITVQPKLIQQLGGDPRQQNSLFNPYVLPPPEKQVDEEGKPIEMLPCATCAGIGYIGRIAIYEMVTMNNLLRKTLLERPSVEAINQAAQKSGAPSLAANGYKLALLGITSVNEAQRALKS